MQVSVKADSRELQHLVSILACVRIYACNITSVRQVELVATGEMSLICGCSGVTVLTSSGTSLSSHPNTPSLFQGLVIQEESFDLTPAVAVRGACDSGCCRPLSRFPFLHSRKQVTVCVMRAVAKQKCLR